MTAIRLYRSEDGGSTYSQIPSPDEVMEMSQRLIDGIAEPEQRELMQLEHDILLEKLGK